jgi:hypothetical protein
MVVANKIIEVEDADSEHRAVCTNAQVHDGENADKLQTSNKTQ